MSRFSSTFPQVGDARSAAVITSIFSALTTGDSTLTGANFRRHSIDWRGLEADEAESPILPTVLSGGPTTLTASGSYAAIAIGGTDLTAVNYPSGDITVPSKAVLVVHAGVAAVSTATGPVYGIPAATTLNVELYYKPNGGIDLVFPTYTRVIRQVPAGTDGADAFLQTFGVLTGPLTLDYVSLFGRSVGGDCRLNHGFIYGYVIKQSGA